MNGIWDEEGILMCPAAISVRLPVVIYFFQEFISQWP
jgi:hypothetical protein